MDTIKELAKLVPIVRDGPTWLQLMFSAALVSMAVFAVGLVVYLVSRGASVDEFAVKSPRNGQYVSGREMAIEGNGLPSSDQLRIEVNRVEVGQRTSIPQTDTALDRRPDQTWRYQWVRFSDPGDHEVTVRVIRAGKEITYAGPIEVHVGEWARSPEISGTTPIVEVRPSKDYPSDLSPYVGRVYDQGAEGSNAAFAAITTMEVAFAVAGTHRSLSARYLYSKARQLDRSPEGTFMTSIAYVVQKFGVPPASVWPYTPGVDNLPPGLTWKDLDGLASQNRVRLFGPIPIEDIAKQLKSGRPLLAGVRAYEKAWLQNSTGIIDAPSKDDREVGEHAIAIVGFDDRDGSIKFANSWGTKWGQKGFGLLTKAGAKAYLEPDEIWAVEPISQ
jgi:Papain family cysteine protease